MHGIEEAIATICLIQPVDAASVAASMTSGGDEGKMGKTIEEEAWMMMRTCFADAAVSFNGSAKPADREPIERNDFFNGHSLPTFGTIICIVNVAFWLEKQSEYFY